MNVNGMATESFYQDLVIDTPEAAAAFIDMWENDRHYVGPLRPMPWADEAARKRLAEHLKEKYSGEELEG